MDIFFLSLAIKTRNSTLKFVFFRRYFILPYILQVMYAYTHGNFSVRPAVPCVLRVARRNLNYYDARECVWTCVCVFFFILRTRKGPQGSYLFAYRKQIKLTTCASCGHPLFDPRVYSVRIMLYNIICNIIYNIYDIYPSDRCPFFTIPSIYVPIYVIPRLCIVIFIQNVGRNLRSAIDLYVYICIILLYYRHFDHVMLLRYNII